MHSQCSKGPKLSWVALYLLMNPIVSLSYAAFSFHEVSDAGIPGDVNKTTVYSIL
jgi:hypothetical protein